MFNAPDSLIVAARDILLRTPARPDVAPVRDVARRGVCVVAVRDFVVAVRADTLVVTAPRGATDVFDVFVRETTFAPRRVDVARDAVRESVVATAARSRPDVVVPRAPMFVCVFCDDVTVFAPRIGEVFEILVAVARDAARTISSYSTPRASHNAGTTRHTAKSSLKIFIPFTHRVAKL